MTHVGLTPCPVLSTGTTPSSSNPPTSPPSPTPTPRRRSSSSRWSCCWLPGLVSGLGFFCPWSDLVLICCQRSNQSCQIWSRGGDFGPSCIRDLISECIVKFSEFRSVGNRILSLPRLPPASSPTVLRTTVLQSVRQKIFRRFFAGTRLVCWKDHGNPRKSPSKEEKLLMIFSDEEIMVSFLKVIFPPQDSRI